MRLLSALTASLVVSSAHAEEAISFEVLLGQGAMICDHAESVVTSLERGFFMPDCGQFTTRTGAPVRVTIIGQYEDKPLAMFEFLNPVPWGNQVQYGWWAGKIPTNAPEGVDA